MKGIVARGFLVALIASSLARFVAAAQRADSKLDQVLAHIAPEAQMIVAVPSLKRLNDDLVELFGGMDRADLVTAGRPIDMAKSFLGLGGGIDDRRGAAMALLPRDGAAPAHVAIIPVVDPDAFVETNFKHDEATGAYTAANGMTFYIRTLDENFVLLSERKDVAERYDAGDGARGTVETLLGEASQEFFARGEVLVIMNQEGMRLAAKATPFGGGAFPGAVGASEPSPVFEAIAEQVSGLAYVVDVDPLGVKVHGLLTFLPESTLGTALHEPQPITSSWLQSLPDKKYYWAGNVNLEAAGALEVLKTTAALFDIELITSRNVLEGAKQISFIASPSPLGPLGGLLNDAALVIHTDDPQAMHTAVREALDNAASRVNERLAATHAESGSTTPAPAFEITWEDDTKVGDTGLTADAYVWRAPAGPNMMMGMARAMTFGQRQQGFLATADNAVVLTFSHRPAVLEAAIDAIKDEGESLADDDVLASVARWMGEPAPVEVYISLGQLNKFAALAARTMGPMAGEIDMPELDPNGPPIALRFGVGERSMTSSLGLPAPVLADILREVERAQRPFTGGTEDVDVHEQ